MKDKIYHKWWFWVICGFVFLIAINIMFSDEACDCTIYKRNLNDCEQKIVVVQDAWNDYLDAFEEYCRLDDTNLLCKTIPQR